MYRLRSALLLIAIVACAMLASGGSHCAADEPVITGAEDSMLQVLKSMAAKDPSHADTWRLIGRIHRQHYRYADAYSAYRRALYLQPDNAAIHFDLGELHNSTGNEQAAREHFAKVVELAPDSTYAKQLIDQGKAAAPQPVFAAVDHEAVEDVADGRNDTAASLWSKGAELAAAGVSRSNAEDVRLFLETGALYSTNVGLAPISRELSASQGAGYQGFLSPDIEWISLRRDRLRFGPMMRGYYTINENQFRSLDIASFQPGVFLERDFPSWGVNDVTARIEYVYSLDLLGGSRFGDRHAVTASFTAAPSEQNLVYGYVATGWANFSDDGANPATDSLDGPSYNMGISRIRMTDWRFIPTTSFGLDYENVDAEGADYRYHGLAYNGSTTFQLLKRLQLTTRTGIGFRHYGDFTGTVNRDELTLRAGARLQWNITDVYSVSTLVDYNRFASINESFDTERTEAGVVFTILR